MAVVYFNILQRHILDSRLFISSTLTIARLWSSSWPFSCDAKVKEQIAKVKEQIAKVVHVVNLLHIISKSPGVVIR